MRDLNSEDLISRRAETPQVIAQNESSIFSRSSYRSAASLLGLQNTSRMSSLHAPAKPYAFSFEVDKTALVLSKCVTSLHKIVSQEFSAVDFQKDFIEPGGFGEIQGANLKDVQASVEPAKRLLNLARRSKLGAIIHTREGHDPSLNDCPTPKVVVLDGHC